VQLVVMVAWVVLRSCWKKGVIPAGVGWKHAYVGEYARVSVSVCVHLFLVGINELWVEV
jgi:hypothetical protein